MDQVSQAELAERAGVEKAFVGRLVEQKILEATQGQDDQIFRPSDVYRVRFVQSCERAGIPADSLAAAIREDRMTLAFMDQPSYRWASLTSKTFRELAEETGLRVELLLGMEEAMGAPRPDPDDPVREDLERGTALLQVAHGGGFSDSVILRLTRVAGDGMRRMAEAERHVWRSYLETPMLESGMSATEMAEATNVLGAALSPLQEQALLSIYRRAQERVWTENWVEHLEDALEEMGLYRRPDRPPAMAFLDISGYTRLTEERGDQAAAELASTLADVVQGDVQRHGGRSVKWLGDGVMLHFSDPGDAVESTLAMGRHIPDAGLPSVHAGIASGPVVIQDGDYFGRTVNLASRLAGRAAAGQTLVTDDVARTVARPSIRFREIGPVELKGVTHPVRVHEALSSQ